MISAGTSWGSTHDASRDSVCRDAGQVYLNGSVAEKLKVPASLMSYFEVCTYMYINRVYKTRATKKIALDVFGCFSCFLLLNFPLNIFLCFSIESL